MLPDQAQTKFELATAPSKVSDHNVALDFVRSAAYSAIQEPVTGLAQIADSVFHSNLADRTQVLSAPQPAKFGSLDWHAQTIGSALGMIVPFLIVRKSLGPILGQESASFATSKAALGLSLKEAAATGFVYDSLLKPSQGDNFVADRFLNGIGGAATFSALTLGSIGLGKVSSIGLAREIPMLNMLRNPVLNGVLAGVPGGLVAAGVDGLRHGHGLSGQEAWQSVYAMSLVGGAFGVKSAVRENRTLAQNLESNHSPDRHAASPVVSSLFRNANPQYALEDALIADTRGTAPTKAIPGDQSRQDAHSDALSSPSLKLNRLPDGSLSVEHSIGNVELIKADLSDEQQKLEQLAETRLKPEVASQFRLAVQEFTQVATAKGFTGSEQAIVLRQLHDVLDASPDSAVTIIGRAAIDAALPARTYQDSMGVHFVFGNKEINYQQSTGVTLSVVPEKDIFNEVTKTQIPGDTEGGIWLPRRSFSAFSPSEIAAMVSHLPQEYQLAQPEVVKDYAQKFERLTQGWEETQPKVLRSWRRELLTRETLLEELESYRKVKADVLKAVKGKELPAPVTVKDLQTSATALLEFVRQHGDKFGMTANEIETADAKLTKFLEVRNQHAKLRHRTDTLLQAREKDLQGFLTEFSDAHGLPQTHLKLSETPPLTQATHSNGILRLARETLLGLNRADLGGVLFHEMLHGEQQTLTLRNLADELKIGADYSELDAQQLQALYSERRVHAPIEIERIKDVLSVRHGQPLSDNQILTSMQLDLALPNATKDPLSTYSAKEFKKVESTLRELEGQNGANKTEELFDQFAQDEKTVYATIPFQYGATSSELPMALRRLIDARQGILAESNPQQTHGTQIEWNTQRARDYLIESLRERQNEINSHRERHWVQYTGRKHEWDAWLAGELAQAEIEAVNPATKISPPEMLYSQALRLAIEAPQFRLAASQRR